MSAANRDRARDLVDNFLSGARTVDAFVRRVERELDDAEARGRQQVTRDAMTTDTAGGAE